METPGTLLDYCSRRIPTPFTMCLEDYGFATDDQGVGDAEGGVFLTLDKWSFHLPILLNTSCLLSKANL